VRQPERTRRLSQLWWAVRVGLWLCGLPILLRRHPLPAFLRRLTPVRGRRECSRPLALPHATRVVVRVCQLRCFRLPIFPQACLRRALALYYVLTRCGYAVEIHFGIRRAGEVLHGHSWVTVQGQPVAEHTRTDLFTVVYSYASTAGRCTHRTKHSSCEGGTHGQ
jgi:Transglutaminase-like superfamily